jgi:hypothetical protein
MDNVVFLARRRVWRASLRRAAARVADELGSLGWVTRVVVRSSALLAVGLLKAAVLALLVLFEPFLRLTLLPLAFGCFAMSLLFGLLLHAPGFPTWGMFALSIGLLWVYWLYLAVMMGLGGVRRG